MKIRLALIAVALCVPVVTGCDSDDDPFAAATFRISNVSTVQLAGSTAGLAAQEIRAAGSDLGGRLVLEQPMAFPEIALAFGQTMTITQADPSSGEFDASTGTVTLPIVLEATDTEGDAAPVAMTLTTGTVTAPSRSVGGESVTGSPRDPMTGVVRLVGLEPIPAGYDNGGEGSLLVVEILATLEFTSAEGLGMIPG